MSQEELVRNYPPRQLLKTFRQVPDRRDVKAWLQHRILARELYEQKLYRAVYSERQLQEVLTDFWFNHFNVYIDKGADRFLVTSYERDAIRPHVLGSSRNC